MSTLRASATINQREVEAVAALQHRLSRAFHFLMDNVTECKNSIGGVIGYELHLNAVETHRLWKILEGKE